MTGRLHFKKVMRMTVQIRRSKDSAGGPVSYRLEDRSTKDLRALRQWYIERIKKAQKEAGGRAVKVKLKVGLDVPCKYVVAAFDALATTGKTPTSWTLARRTPAVMKMRVLPPVEPTKGG